MQTEWTIFTLMTNQESPTETQQNEELKSLHVLDAFDCDLIPLLATGSRDLKNIFVRYYTWFYDKIHFPV